MITNPKAYQFDFDGACIPREGEKATKTFSVGIFQWVPKSSGRGLKRSKSIKRIKGLGSEPETVLAQARTACADLQHIHGYNLYEYFSKR